MLSLVAYGNSDSEHESSNENSENEDEIENAGTVQVVTKVNGEASNSGDENIRAGQAVIKVNGETNNSDVSGIFMSLPEPQLKRDDRVVEEEEDEFLKKKEVPTEKPKKPAIKISIPSLAEFESDEEEDERPVKKQKMIEKQCGLFALLPPPKTVQITTVKHFVPHSVKRNMNRNVKPKIVPTVANSKQILTDVQDSDDDDDMKNLPETYDDDMWQKVCGKKEKRTPKPKVTESLELSLAIQPNPEVEKPYEGLNNQAFKELISANSKRKGDTIDIIDINEDEILADKNIWMTKSLTDPEMAPKHVVENPVNDTCKRKHHITYLAQQAKANEQELQNQWAASRFTRQKTQAKYGF